MTAENTPKSGAGALAAGGTALALVLVAMGWWLTRGGDAPSQKLTDEAPTPQVAQPVADAPQPDAVQPDTTPDLTEDATATPAPTFDVVRVEPDGSAVIAGQAAPGSEVRLMVGETMVGTAESDGNGNFVALLDLPPSDAPQVMRLMVDGETAQTSDQSVIIRPVVDGRDATGRDVAAADTAATEPLAQDADATEIATDIVQEAGPDEADAEAAPQVLLADQHGIRVLQDTNGAQGVSQVQLDTISYDAQGDVAIAGRGAATSSLRAHLNNEFLAETRVGTDGQWHMDLPDIAPGVYILRIDELDATGKVLSQVETPFKREDPVQLAAQLSGTEGAKAAGQTGTEEGSAAIGSDPTATKDAASDAVTSNAAETASADQGQTGSENQPAASAATIAARSAPGSDPGSDEPSAPAEVVSVDGEAGAGTAVTGAADSSPAPIASAAAGGADVGAEIIAPPTIEPTANPSSTAATASEAQPQRPALVTVQPGATLWAIARENLGDGVMYVQVFDANRDKIRNPDLIYPGQVFAVPSGN